jgi:hypothetical protein
MDDAKSIILKILDTIDYSDDKERFADEFLQSVQLHALSNLIQSLPADRQNEIKEELTKNSNSPDVVAGVLKKYFSESEIQQSVQKEAQDAVSDYIKTINNSLSAEQRNNIIKLAGEIRQNIPQSA